MQIQVLCGGEVLFDAGSEGSVLVTFDQGERDQVFHALTAALATLSGVKPLYQPGAKEVATDGHCSKTAQYPADRTSGVVVPLRAPQVDQA